MLTFSAGREAFRHIRENGLKADDVKVMAGAAGGPKWLVLSHLDRAIFSAWFSGRTQPLYLIGSSSGAWRFASVCQKDPLAAIDRFQYAYIHQFYKNKPNPAEIHREGQRILQYLLGMDGVREILSHPVLRLNVMAVRCKGLLTRDEPSIQFLGMLSAIAANAIHRKGLSLFFERALFYDPRDIPPFFNMKEFPIRKVALFEKNLGTALIASGSIPLIMSGVREIPGAQRGVYRDGGIIDYHMDIPFLKSEGIVLFLHYSDRIIPGWLDKQLPWRKPSASNMQRVLLVSPSKKFIQQLPHHKIPDRSDFKRFFGKDKERIAYWYKAVELSKILADEFMEAVTSGKIQKTVTLKY